MSATLCCCSLKTLQVLDLCGKPVSQQSLAKQLSPMILCGKHSGSRYYCSFSHLQMPDEQGLIQSKRFFASKLTLNSHNIGVFAVLSAISISAIGHRKPQTKLQSSTEKRGQQDHVHQFDVSDYTMRQFTMLTLRFSASGNTRERSE